MKKKFGARWENEKKLFGAKQNSAVKGFRRMSLSSVEGCTWAHTHTHTHTCLSCACSRWTCWTSCPACAIYSACNESRFSVVARRLYDNCLMTSSRRVSADSNSLIWKSPQIRATSCKIKIRTFGKIKWSKLHFILHYVMPQKTLNGFIFSDFNKDKS